ncbi:hypothetical protein BASA81_012436 [Batrachochytrium salamandrivorans]|nr:hypothetical protein BASA81_012436 [Batrachochytrium salamandrivorans]
MRAVVLAAGLDMVVSLGLVYHWWSTADSIDIQQGGMSDSLGDLLLVFFPLRILLLAVSAWMARWIRAKHWQSRSLFRRRMLIPKLLVFTAWTSTCLFALLKALSRVVESAESDFEVDISNPTFYVTNLVTIGLAYLDGRSLRNLFVGYYVECQQARRVLRKQRRGTVVNTTMDFGLVEQALVTPLLATRTDNANTASQFAMQFTPHSYLGNTADNVSDHDSDDDSSSDEDEQIPGQGNFGTRQQVSRNMRKGERNRRIRERRRKTKEDQEMKLDTGASLQELAKFTAPDALYLSFALVCLIVAAIAGALIPRYTGQVINHVSGADPNREAFEHSVLMLTISAIVAGVFSGVRGATFTVVFSRMNIRLRKALYRALLNLDQSFFDVTKLGELNSRLSNNTTTVSDQITLNINILLRSLMEGSIVLVLMFQLSWRLSLLSFAAIPLLTLISTYYGEFYRKLVDITIDSLADTSGFAEEALGAIGTVRDFGARRSERRVYSEELGEYYKYNLKESLAYSAFALTWTAIPALITALTLWEGGKLVLDHEPGTPCGSGGSLCSGDLVSFMLYSSSLSNTIDSIGDIYSGLAGALGAADKIFDLLRQKPKVIPKGDEIPEDEQEVIGGLEEPFTGTVELRDVCFRYPTRPTVLVLDKFNLKVDQGQVVALVGESGGGKSSVIRLILHHYAPESGEVLVNGRPVGDYEQRVLRRRLSVVNQEPTLFARSVLRNIVYGLEGCEDEPSFEEVVAAAKLAHAHDFIMKLPKKYATLIGERGSTLSGGQKQRLCIARALVRKPRILLLDESTSALDAESEAKVLEALDDVMHSGDGMSVVVVAHRLSTIKNADKIVVVDKGAVAEQGSHDQLLKLGGKYSDLVKRQIEQASAVLQE